jgi:hypothetical protein
LGRVFAVLQHPGPNQYTLRAIHIALVLLKIDTINAGIQYSISYCNKVMTYDHTVYKYNMLINYTTQNNLHLNLYSSYQSASVSSAARTIKISSYAYASAYVFPLTTGVGLGLGQL